MEQCSHEIVEVVLGRIFCKSCSFYLGQADCLTLAKIEKYNSKTEKEGEIEWNG